MGHHERRDAEYSDCHQNCEYDDSAGTRALVRSVEFKHSQPASIQLQSYSLLLPDADTPRTRPNDVLRQCALESFGQAEIRNRWKESSPLSANRHAEVRAAPSALNSF